MYKSKENFKEQLSSIIDEINKDRKTETHSFQTNVQDLICILGEEGMRKNKGDINSEAILKSCTRALKKAKEVDELIKYDITNKRYVFVKDNLDNRKSLYKKLDQVMRHVQYLLSEYHEKKDTKIAFINLEKDYNLAEKELR